MFLTIDNPAKLADLKKQAYARIKFGVSEAVEMYIRRQFDAACIESTAIAAIEVAEELNLSDLAEEMKADFHLETGKEVGS